MVPLDTTKSLIVPLLVIMLLILSRLEVISPILPSFVIPLLIVLDEARVIFEIVPPELFVIPFVMVLVSFRVRFTIVALELLVIVPIEEVPSKVRLSIVA